jgi:hypothetical protein
MSCLQALPGELRRKIHFYFALNEWRYSGAFAVERAVSGVDRKFLFPYVDPSGDTMLATSSYGLSHSEVICVHSMTDKAAQGVRLRIPGRVLLIYSRPGVGPFLVVQSWDLASVTVSTSTGEIFAQRSVPIPARGPHPRSDWLDTDASFSSSDEWVRAGRSFYRMPALTMSLPAPATLQQGGLSGWAIFGPDGNECLAVSVWTAEEDEHEAREAEEGVCRLQIWELRSGRYLRTLAPSFAIDEGQWSFLPGQHAARLHHYAAFYTALFSLDDGRVLFRVERTDVHVEDSTSRFVWLLNRVGEAAALSCYDFNVGALLRHTLPENNGFCSYFDSPCLLGIRSASNQEIYRFMDPRTQSSVTVSQPAAIAAACLHANALFYVVRHTELLIEVWMVLLDPIRQPRLVLSRPLHHPFHGAHIRFLKPVDGPNHPPMLCLGTELWSFPMRSPL